MILQSVAQGEVVFRMVKHGHDQWCPPDKSILQPSHFDLSTGDYEDAKRREINPLLSVWDSGKTNIGEAHIHRDAHESYSGVSLQVDSLLKLSWCQVLRDPLHTGLAGDDAHCGIEGLTKERERPKRAALAEYRHRREAIYRLALADESPTMSQAKTTTG